MSETRKPLGKTTRFNIFKRDFFKCQYCGSTPPSVVLEVDHIIPVSKGGDNNELNLITSCFDCNRGKRDTLLTIKQSPANIEIIAEKEAQYLAYKQLLTSINKRAKKEITNISNIYEHHYDGDYVMTESFKNTSLKSFLSKLGYDEVEDAIYKALAKDLYKPNDTIKYFCGICHNKINKR